MEMFTNQGVEYFVWRMNSIRAKQENRAYTAIALLPDGSLYNVWAWPSVDDSGVSVSLGETFVISTYEAFLRNSARRRAWRAMHNNLGCYTESEFSDSHEPVKMCAKYCNDQSTVETVGIAYDELTLAEESDLRTVIEAILYKRARNR